MVGSAPLFALLSQLLVASTIEFDNAAEQRIRHRTARGPAAGRSGLWLVSQPMWVNFLRFVDGTTVPLAELAGPVRMTNLGGLRRWGYLKVGPPPAEEVRLTAAGQAAAEVFRPLAAEIQDRWKSRFGTHDIESLRSALSTVLDTSGEALPRHLPVTAVQAPGGHVWAPAREDPATLDLSALLAQVLLLFTADYDRARAAGPDSSSAGSSAGSSPGTAAVALTAAPRPGGLALPVAANALRVLTPGGVPVRDLPVLAGVAREQIASSIILLERAGLLTLTPAAAGRGKQALLTDRGAGAQRRYRQIVAGVEDAWRGRYGVESIDRLDAVLRAIIGQKDAMIETLAPPPSGWRANRPYTARTKALLADPAAGLPHYPMVSHRGGYPDGS